MKTKKNISFNISFILVSLIIILFIVLSYRVIQIDKQITTYPAWIDMSLYPILQSKVNKPLLYKMGEIIFCRNNYMSWSSIEIILDELIDKIKQTNINFDAIVGIKSGGAILTKYISNKLNIDYYYVKVSDKDYKCDKKTYHIADFAYKAITNNKSEYMLCEPIDENIENKNILLFDELIFRGSTITNCINYLVNEKGVNMVFPVTVVSNKEKYDTFTPLYYRIGIQQQLWPWGYDN
jgi:hypoxanthine phosphoribosyltransferase